ncbi:MAG TPA: VOC family protein [Candidatus Dormibacteraeota bacterium]|nr:VOC family protein [Candidatus Dormibacteraeota bacterium]
MQTPSLKVLFIAGFGPIGRDAAASRRLYVRDLGLSFKEETGGYLHTEDLAGAKTFALWPLTEAARACFGSDSWPENLPIPQAWLEFEVDSIEGATATLEQCGWQMLVRLKKEPWGQTVSRFVSPEGLLLAVTLTPSMRSERPPDS